MKKTVLMILLWLASGAAGFCQSDRSPSAPEPESSPRDPVAQSDWHITWVPAYLWLSGVNGNLGVLGKTVPIELASQSSWCFD